MEQLVIETGNESLFPLSARALTVTIAACGDADTAARCSGVVEGLVGVGDQGQYNPEYQPALDGLRRELGNERFERLREEGRRLTVMDLHKIGKRLVAEHHD